MRIIKILSKENPVFKNSLKIKKFKKIEIQKPYSGSAKSTQIILNYTHKQKN